MAVNGNIKIQSSWDRQGARGRESERKREEINEISAPVKAIRVFGHFVHDLMIMTDLVLFRNEH